MTKEESAKVLSVWYVYECNTFWKSDRLRSDLADIRIEYKFMDGESQDAEFNTLFEKYCDELKTKGRDNPPVWAKRIMAERYSLNV